MCFFFIWISLQEYVVIQEVLLMDTSVDLNLSKEEKFVSIVVVALIWLDHRPYGVYLQEDGLVDNDRNVNVREKYSF